MKVRIYKDPKYTFTWPTQDPTPEEVHRGFRPIPEEEKIIFHLKRLPHKAKRVIEDSMFSMKGSQFERANKAKDTSEMSMGYSVGTVKDMRLRESIEDWSNVLDEEGDPIKWSWGAFTELLACNADLDIEVYGSLETELLQCVDKHNGFTEEAKATVKN